MGKYGGLEILLRKQAKRQVITWEEEKEGKDFRWTHFLLIWLNLQEGCRRAKLRRHHRSLIVKSYASGVMLLSKKSS